MSAGEVAALIAAVASAILCVGVLFAMASLTRTLRSVRVTVEEVRSQAVPLLGKLNTTVDQANAELARVDGLMDRAENVGATVDSASRLAYMAFANPVIKLMSLGSGAAKAARLLRGRKGEK
ncbi:MAG TPA: DUF948 domain-containing protein [Acidimicrobiales bacterium]|nr:DUF948 domain-containing protein [Acidimicrobiales bacterium]